MCSCTRPVEARVFGRTPRGAKTCIEHWQRVGDAVDMRVCLVLEVDVANEVKRKRLVNELCIWMSRLTAKSLEKVDGVIVQMAQAIRFAFFGAWVFRAITTPVQQKRIASRTMSLSQTQVDASVATTELR